MGIKKIIIVGIIAGLIMGITLFISGAILARIIYGPQMVPEGKFEPSQINAFYFIWTKLVIGVFFGILFTYVYAKLPLSNRIKGPVQGGKYAFVFWLVISLWNLSHPLLYESINFPNQLFWLSYTLCGFLSFGYVLGLKYKGLAKKN